MRGSLALGDTQRGADAAGTLNCNTSRHAVKNCVRVFRRVFQSTSSYIMVPPPFNGELSVEGWKQLDDVKNVLQ